MKWTLRIIGFLAVVLGGLFLVFRTPDTDPAEMRAKYGGEPSQFVLLENGQKLHLRDEGPRDALPIILLHGSASDMHTWQAWVEGLRENYRVIRYDQIGHGLTGPAAGGTYRREDFTSDIERVANHLELNQFVLAGSSMGGAISVGYALEHPERLLGLVLVGASGSPVRNPDRAGGSIGFKLARMPVIKHAMEYITPRSLIEKSLQQSVSVKSVASDEAVDRYWEMLRYPGNRSATVARFGTPRENYTAQQMAQIAVPALLLFGEEDALIPLAAGEWYEDNLPNSRIVVYPGIGHLPHEEATEATLDELKNWLVNLSETI